MAFSSPQNIPGTLSRRSFFRVAAGVSTFSVLTESLLAQSAASAEAPKFARSDRGIHLDANENPMGPSEAARKAVAEILPRSGRYLFDLQEDLKETFARSEGIDPKFVALYAGSSTPLHLTVLAYSSARCPVIVADPGYEAPLWAAKVSGAPGIRVPLAEPKGAAVHDVKAMLAASSTPGIIYICNPNNPTGTITPREEIEYAVSHAPKGSIVMIDEAYIHLSTNAKSCIDLVAEGRDVVVLRTFSKLYGMAGLRLGVVVAKPEVLKKIASLAGLDSVPVTAVAAGKASLLDHTLVPERRKIVAEIRTQTIAWLKQQGYATTPAESNCFMVDMGRPAGPVRRALAAREIYVGREWSAWPNFMRVTVGTAEEMAAFRRAFAEVVREQSAGILRDTLPIGEMPPVRFFS